MKKFFVLLLLLNGCVFVTNAQTWAGGIAEIFYQECGSCHNDSGVAPFALTDYQEVKQKGNLIQWALETGHMPPWPPNPSYRKFAYQRTLTDQQKTDLISWIGAGMPSGDLAQTPPVPDYPTGGDLPGTPDLVLKIPTYTVQNPNGDEYRCFVIPNAVTQDKFVTAWEIVPGNREIVHHVVVFQDETNQCLLNDLATPEPGYVCFGGACNNAEMIGVWAPGGNPLVYPQGFGMKLKGNADIIIQMHYPDGSAGQVDSTEIHLFFAPQNTGMREVLFDIVADPFSTIQNGPFIIPGNTVKTFNTSLTLDQGVDFTLLRVLPHMHLLGKSVKAWVEPPGGGEVPLIHIPQWDFHWQGMYTFQQLLRLKNNSKIKTEFIYDNTVMNPNNPNSPPKLVAYGEATTDEMLFLFIEYTLYQPGDENILMDSTLLTPVRYLAGGQTGAMLFATQPNPVNDHAAIPFYLPESQRVSVSIFDVNGREVDRPLPETLLPQGYHQANFYGHLSAGLYFVRLACENGGVKTSKFVVK